jgi:hypothetical protein
MGYKLIPKLNPWEYSKGTRSTRINAKGVVQHAKMDEELAAVLSTGAENRWQAFQGLRSSSSIFARVSSRRLVPIRVKIKPRHQLLSRG